VDEQRLGEIRERLERYRRAVEWDEERAAELVDVYASYSKDIPALISALEELQGELRRIERENYVYRVMDEELKRLEEDNGRLQNVKRAAEAYLDSLPYKPTLALELMVALDEANHPIHPTT